ncbi:D-alanyl-D-alanine carboxypeptidase [Palleronia marisminoris]|uniref:D-alanyl-D-alanine carboxypeptidase DacF n=1 Tax=Palleronia marisminoris TaxID=315423 RepID=A0A1Y5SL02_9RHOB|nr:D-alanyl-D-alanine carboxypeptidase [Palleronia marisminoris]SLN40285.1 D-alanyl-D-alanine carboxypeptidase DacF precursor [Palleronia marisminoris]
MAIRRLTTPLGVLLSLVVLFATPAIAAPYAAMVIDARSGQVLHERNADARLHPASLTKMLTLYIAFEAVEKGEISLDTKVTISKNAASEPPSKLGLRAGQQIALRYLIRAAAVKSANDAATALGEAISGSEANFTARMDRTAKALGMTQSTFKNAHGLTASGHLSTARDMTTLGRHLFYDFPQYYNLFSRQSADAGLAVVHHTNRRLLSSYQGADGIKTGFTNAAGFNLTASAERGGERIIATVFGGRSTATRDAKVAELLDLGFSRAPSRVAVVPPAPPNYNTATGAGSVAVARSLRPALRPVRTVALSPDLVAQAVEQALPEALAEAPMVTEATAPVPTLAAAPTITPEPRSRTVAMAEAEIAAEQAVRPQGGEVVTRMSSSGGRHYGINVGRFGSRYAAEQVLLKTALTEIGTLDDALRKVVQSPKGWEANFVGMTQDRAALACQRLSARDVTCNTLGPG